MAQEPNGEGGYDMTSGDVARALSVSLASVARWADTGLLPCHRLPGGHRRFRREDVERFRSEGRVA